MTQKVSVKLQARSDHPVIQYAIEDISRILGLAGTDVNTTDADWTFELDVDQSLQPDEFTITCDSGSNRVSISGYDPSCALHAAYTALEQAGVLFDFTGPILPQELKLDALNGWSTSIIPTVKRRGIRQHINFPMDISSYSLEEAKEYIRNLARMRMNIISFHSYPGQWYNVKLPDRELKAGGFFYTRTHIVPDHPAFKDVRNEEIFCIPELEPFFDNPDKKSEYAILWLQELMIEAKRAGMIVHFSFEPRNEPLDDCVATAEAILGHYPMIDRLELITQECGSSWDPSVFMPADELRNFIPELFGPDALDDESVAKHVKDGLWQLPGTLRELAKNIKVFNALKKRWKDTDHPTLVAGIYCTDPGSLNVTLALMRKYLPEDIEFAFMPAHGGRAAAESVSAMDFSPEDLKRTMIHSWIEFDGDMFLQENSVIGTRQLLDNLKRVAGEDHLQGICFNHWRTTENRTPARYAALACIDHQYSVDQFYRDYARSLGIEQVGKYSRAMQVLDDADTDARNRLGNIGFCFEGCWWVSPGKMGYIEFWKTPLLDEIRYKFEEAGRMLKDCQSETRSQAGIDYLELLVNRIDCTSLHLQSMAKLTELQDVCGDAEPGTLDEESRAKVRAICDDAFAIAEKYAYRYAEALPDRGCEGTIISYYDTIWIYISKLREKFGGEGYFRSVEQIKDDAPPPPAI